MALLLLTHENIEHAKSAMRGVFPQVRAAHRVEALAAGLSFQTYASLLAAIKLGKRPYPLVGSVELARFSARLHDLGYANVDPHGLTDVVRSLSMPQRPWAEYKNGDWAVNNRWYRECQRRDIPDIYIATRAKYVKLNWDCISRDSKHDTHLGEDSGVVLLQQMFNRFQELARPNAGRAIFQGNSFVGHIDNLPPDVARNIADAFFIMLTAPPEQKMVA